MTKEMKAAVRAPNPDDGSGRHVGGVVPEYHTSGLNGKPLTTVSELGALPIWAGWQLMRDPKNRRGMKPPLNPSTGHGASTKDSTTWGTRKAAETLRSRLRGTAGIGIMLGSLKEPEGWVLAALDLDGCRDPETGTVAPWASAVVARLAGYAEVSPSNTGVRLVFVVRASDVAELRASGLLPPGGAGVSFALPGDHVEIAVFFERKFMSITDKRLSNDDSIHQIELEDLRWLIGDHGPACKAQGRTGTDNRTRGGGGLKSNRAT